MTNLEKFMNEQRTKGMKSLYPAEIKLTVGRATCGRASGAEKVYQALQDEIQLNRLKTVIASTGCMGFCQQEPLVYVQIPGHPRFVYGKFNEMRARELVQSIVNEKTYTKNLLGIVNYDENVVEDVQQNLVGQKNRDATSYPELKEHQFYKGQYKIATRNCGYIDPQKIEEYIARGGYLALNSIFKRSHQEVIEMIKASGLRGRGGGGFPTGLKWQFAANNDAPRKYIICNADEGDPGAYMDRSILEGDPHSIIEGMIIGGYAIGADTGIIYCRAEYPLAVETISKAIDQARKAGLLGKGIAGNKFDFDIKIVKGAGAFVCGEETALISSIEGKMGEPRPRPPFPAQKGLWGCPTIINNVETLANISPIVYRGADWYGNIGTEKSTGTKVFALVGDIRNNGLVEVPMGTTIRDIVYKIGGGEQKKLEVKAVQTGGPSGGCIPEKLFDIPVDYDRLAEAGAIMGSGGMVVMNERSCMVDVARFFMQFTQQESCGKCVPCREGTKRMLAILEDICEGKVNQLEVLDTLRDLATVVKETSLCGLGQTVPNPILSTLKHFGHEYESHIVHKYCSAGVCKDLFYFYIDPEICKGCGLCAKACPQQAIQGEKGNTFIINQDKCLKCRICFQTCNLKAVKVVPSLPKESETNADNEN